MENLYFHLNICVLLSCWLVSKFTASAPDLNSLRSPFGVSPLHLLSYRLSELGSEPKQTGAAQRQCQLNGRNHTRQLHTKTHNSNLHVYRTLVHPVGWTASLWCCFSFIRQLHSVIPSFHSNRLQKQAAVTISSHPCASRPSADFGSNLLLGPLLLSPKRGRVWLFCKTLSRKLRTMSVRYCDCL